jgi:hypothetical protein
VAGRECFHKTDSSGLASKPSQSPVICISWELEIIVYSLGADASTDVISRDRH